MSAELGWVRVRAGWMVLFFFKRTFNHHVRLDQVVRMCMPRLLNKLAKTDSCFAFQVCVSQATHLHCILIPVVALDVAQFVDSEGNAANNPNDIDKVVFEVQPETVG